MSKVLSLIELRSMNAADLRREIEEQRHLVEKLRLTIALGKEKGTHLLLAGKRQLARMLTVEQGLSQAKSAV